MELNVGDLFVEDGSERPVNQIIKIDEDKFVWSVPFPDSNLNFSEESFNEEGKLRVLMDPYSDFDPNSEDYYLVLTGENKPVRPEITEALETGNWEHVF